MNLMDKLLPPFNLYHPKKSHPDWEELRKDAFRLALNIAKRINLRKSAIQGTLLTRRKFLALTKTLKNLFLNKIRVARNNHDLIPLFYIWTMTNACNFNCSYCSNHRGGNYPELWRQGYRRQLTTPQGKRLLDVMRESSAIYFCGGEPTLRKDLPVLLEHSTKRNMFNMINTNGSLIGDLLLKPGYENFLAHMDVLIISLDSLTISQLAEMYRVGYSAARKVLRNILALRILQNYVPFKLVANTVITRDTIEESFDILNFCNDLGITFSPVSANIGHEPDWQIVKDPQYVELVKEILDRSDQGFPMIASNKMLKRLLYVEGFHCFPVVFDHIDHDGTIFWPCKAYLGAAKVPVLKYRSLREVHEAASKEINPLNFHGQDKNQCGGNCAWMQNCVTDIYGRTLTQGIFGSGILKEILGLV